MRAVYSAEQLSFGQDFDVQSVHCLFFGIWPDVGATRRLTQLVGATAQRENRAGQAS
jgi:hypothetical protein